MRCLRRNMTEFEYLPSSGVETDLNEDGEHTGEFHLDYGTPVSYKGNISSPSGHMNQTFYGMDLRYTHTLVMENPSVPIDEYGLIRWKDELYEILAVRPSLNSISIALRRKTKAPQDPTGPVGVTGATGATGATGGGDSE